MRADAQRNRLRILEAAEEVFAQLGLAVPIDEVAKRAGVGVGTVYRHFPTKEALMVELVRQKFRLFSATVREALECDGEPLAVLADVLLRNADAAARDATMQQALAGADEHIWTQAQPEQQELSGLTETLIARARQAGTIRPDITAADIGMLMCGVSATMGHNAPGFDWHRHLELVIDMLRRRGPVAGSPQHSAQE